MATDKSHTGHPYDEREVRFSVQADATSVAQR
jgi:hypothetical protein